MTEMLLKIFIIADLETSTFLRGPKSLNHDPHKNVFFTINNPHYNFLLCLNQFYYDLDFKKSKLCNLFVILAIYTFQISCTPGLKGLVRPRAMVGWGVIRDPYRLKIYEKKNFPPWAF